MGTVGILVVHGIGEQRRGTTLRQFGGPFTQFVREVSSNNGGAIEVAIDPLAAADEPAQVTLRLLGGDTPCSVLVAESRWSETFQPASFGGIVGWLLRHGLRTIGVVGAEAWRGLRNGKDSMSIIEDNLRSFADRHGLPGWLLRRLMAMVSRVLRIGRVFLNVTAGLVLLALVVLSGLLPFLLALLVVGRWWKKTRGLAESVRTGLAASLGDAYTFIHRPIDRAAMIAQVRRDTEWMAGRVDSVVVVAHSLGAAITVEALTSPAHRAKVSTVYLLGNALAATGVARRPKWHRPARFDASVLGGVEVIDLSTAQDPVTLGGLRAEGRYSRPRVDNQHSLLRDHTSYFTNTEQVLAPIAADVLTRAGYDTSGLAARLTPAWRIRASRKNVETTATVAALLAFGAVMLGSTAPWLRSVGRWCYDLVGGFLGVLPDNVEGRLRTYLEGGNGRLLFGSLAVGAVCIAVGATLLSWAEGSQDRRVAARLAMKAGRLHRTSLVTKASVALAAAGAAWVVQILRRHADAPVTHPSTAAVWLASGALLLALVTVVLYEVSMRVSDVGSDPAKLPRLLLLLRLEPRDMGDLPRSANLR